MDSSRQKKVDRRLTDAGKFGRGAGFVDGVGHTRSGIGANFRGSRFKEPALGFKFVVDRDGSLVHTFNFSGSECSLVSGDVRRNRARMMVCRLVWYFRASAETELPASALIMNTPVVAFDCHPAWGGHQGSDHTDFSRPSARLTILPQTMMRDEPIHLLIGSRGLKIYYESE